MKRMMILCTTLIVAGLLSSCVMAARKGVGTIVGPRGSMTIVSDTGSIAQGERCRQVYVQNLVGSQVTAEAISELRSAVENQLSMNGYFGKGDAGLILKLQLTRYTDLPARKELDIRAELVRDGQSVAVADMTANLNGFGDRNEVVEAIGKATVRFIKEVSVN